MVNVHQLHVAIIDNQFFLHIEHGGSHGHSHGLSSNTAKLTQLSNSTDDNENNAFMYENQVRTIVQLRFVQPNSDVIC